MQNLTNQTALNLRRSKNILSVIVVILVMACAGCNSSSDTTETNLTTPDTNTSDTPDQPEFDPFAFASGALTETVKTVSCTLSNGEASTCYEITIAGHPATHDVGSFCPRDIYASADEVGIWFDGNGEVYDVDGEFIQSLSVIYSDDNWQLFNESTGLVNITDTQVSCEGAARPDVSAELQNHCVECSLDYYGGGISATYTIPVQPTLASSPSSLGRDDVGVSLSGVAIAPPAPVDAILGAYTIAAFDDCAGHVNPVAGYHYHGSAGCSEIIQEEDGHGARMGFALDGFGIYAMLDQDGLESTNLDSCRGHSDEVRGYHYHAASVAENMFIGCISGLTAN
jgi:hypothetical protein